CLTIRWWMMRIKRIIPEIILIIFSLILFIETFNFATKPGDDVGLAFWPRAVLSVIIILSLVLIFTSFRPKEEREQYTRKSFNRINAIKTSLGISFCVAFVFLFKILGFVISVFLFFVSLYILKHENLSRRSYIFLFIQGTVIVTIIYFLFGTLLKLNL